MAGPRASVNFPCNKGEAKLKRPRTSVQTYRNSGCPLPNRNPRELSLRIKDRSLVAASLQRQSRRGDQNLQRAASSEGAVAPRPTRRGRAEARPTAPARAAAPAGTNNRAGGRRARAWRPARPGSARRSRSEGVSQRFDRSPEPGEGSLEPRRPPARTTAAPSGSRRGRPDRGRGARPTRLAGPRGNPVAVGACRPGSNGGGKVKGRTGPGPRSGLSGSSAFFARPSAILSRSVARSLLAGPSCSPALPGCQ